MVRLQLPDQALYNGGLLLPLGIGHVDDVEQQVGILQLLQGGLEGLHQLMGQLADKAHGVGDHHVQGVADGQEAGGGIQGIKQAVVGGDPGPGDGIEQRGFAGVGVAHDGHHGDLVFMRRWR